MPRRGTRVDLVRKCDAIFRGAKYVSEGLELVVPTDKFNRFHGRAAYAPDQHDEELGIASLLGDLT